MRQNSQSSRLPHYVWVSLLTAFAALVWIASPFGYGKTVEHLGFVELSQEHEVPKSAALGFGKVTVMSNEGKAEQYEKLGLTPNPSIKINSPTFKKTLHGRFLHITDMHPDMFYKANTSYDLACHSGKGKATKYGTAMAGCDSPFILVKETLDWIEANLKDKIDFIIWTGDNVRHDNDRAFPRTELQIFEVNENISTLMIERFKNHKSLDPRDFLVPLAPSLGNNDVYPHNMFALGPTLQSRLLYKTWSEFIPQEQAHVFDMSASFLKEIIPNKLAVLSINTLYLFKSNPLVDNCDNKKQPGYTLYLWLGYTLKELRRRGVKVWLSGHVPPVPKNFDLTCYRKFILWMYEYRDIIVGSVFGHMNLDHFVPLDATLAYESLKKDKALPGFKDLIANFGPDLEQGLKDYEEGEIAALEHIYEALGYELKSTNRDAAKLSSELNALGAGPGLNKVEYMKIVNDVFYKNLVPMKNLDEDSDDEAEVEDKKKKKGKKKKLKKNDGTRYSVIHIAASVVPTFNPGFRVWEYNTTGLYSELSNTDQTQMSSSYKSWDSFFKKLGAKIEKIINEPEYTEEYRDMFETGSFTKKKPDKTLPPKSKKKLPLGPAFAPQTFTPTGFTQYYLDLEAINNNSKPFEYEVEYTSKSGPYKMDSLLANDWVNLGIKLSKDAAKEKKGSGENDKKQKKSIWEKYLERVFVSTGYEDIVSQRRQKND